MKSDMYIKWDIYAKQNDNNFKRYCYRHIGYGFEVFFTTAILLKMNDGNSISKSELIESIQAETLIDSEKVSSCVDSLIELNLLKEEDGKFYSERVRRDIETAKELSEVKAKAGSKGGKAKADNKHKPSTGVAYANQMPSTGVANSKQNLARQLDNKTIRQLDNKTSNKFTPPSLEEVQAYCNERGKGVDAQKFVDYYSTGNWHDSHGDPIKNWKQKMISVWEGKSWWQKVSTLSTGITLGQSGHYKPEDYEGLQEKLDNGEDIF